MLPYNKRTVRVTSPFGMRTLAGKTAMHKGIDLVGSDKNVLAVDSGEVLFSRMVDKSTGNRTWEWGNYICIRTDDGMLHYYCHLESRAVRIGDKVAKGQVIGKEGSTGYSTGNHLHFEVRDKAGTSVDPSDVLGIPNRTGTYDAERLYHREMVGDACGFEAKTLDYLDKYTYAQDLWRKLWGAIKK